MAPGRTRDAVLAFLATSEALPVEARVAAFDNDGTLWCEKPTYVQFDFFEDALRRRAEADPALRERPELAAVLDLDMAAIGELGLERVALALVELFAGIEPEVFTAVARDFMARARHRNPRRPGPGDEVPAHARAARRAAAARLHHLPGVRRRHRVRAGGQPGPVRRRRRSSWWEPRSATS